MRKLFLFLFAAAFVLAANTRVNAGENLLNYVPEKAEILIYFKLADILKHPLVSDLKKNNENFKKSYDEFEKSLKEKNLKLENLIHSIAIFSMKGDDSGAVFTTGVSEDKLKEILSDKDLAKEGITYKEAKMNGKNVLIIETPVKDNDIPNVSLDKQSVLTYLKKDLVLITEKSCFGKVINELKKSNITKNKKMMAWKKDIGSDSLIWALFDLPKKPANAKPANPMMGGADNIEGGMLSLAAIGKDKKDITLDLVLDCKDKQTCGLIAMQAQMITGGLAMQSSSQNPELAMEISKAIVFNSEGKKFKAKVSVPKSLQDKLKELSNKAKNAQPQPAQPSPGTGGKPTLPAFKPTDTTGK